MIRAILRIEKKLLFNTFDHRLFKVSNRNFDAFKSRVSDYLKINSNSIIEIKDSDNNLIVKVELTLDEIKRIKNNLDKVKIEVINNSRVVKKRVIYHKLKLDINNFIVTYDLNNYYNQIKLNISEGNIYIYRSTSGRKTQNNHQNVIVSNLLKSRKESKRAYIDAYNNYISSNKFSTKVIYREQYEEIAKQILPTFLLPLSGNIVLPWPNSLFSFSNKRDKEYFNLFVAKYRIIKRLETDRRKIERKLRNEWGISGIGIKNRFPRLESYKVEFVTKVKEQKIRTEMIMKIRRDDSITQDESSNDRIGIFITKINQSISNSTVLLIGSNFPGSMKPIQYELTFPTNLGRFAETVINKAFQRVGSLPSPIKNIKENTLNSLKNALDFISLITPDDRVDDYICI